VTTTNTDTKPVVDATGSVSRKKVRIIVDDDKETPGTNISNKTIIEEEILLIQELSELLVWSDIKSVTDKLGDRYSNYKVVPIYVEDKPCLLKQYDKNVIGVRVSTDGKILEVIDIGGVDNLNRGRVYNSTSFLLSISQ
jgi:hypothetical protein